jgi:hypothetical protein
LDEKPEEVRQGLKDTVAAKFYPAIFALFLEKVWHSLFKAVIKFIL